MKKSLTKLLIIAIMCGILSMILCINSIKSSRSKTEEVLNKIQNEEEISDVEGYAYIAETSSSMLVDIGESIGITIFVIIIPGFWIFIITVLQITARLIQIGEEKKEKIQQVKGIIITSIVIHVLLCLSLLFNIISNLAINKILVTIAFALNITSVVLFIIELRKMKKLNSEIKTEVIE